MARRGKSIATTFIRAALCSAALLLVSSAASAGTITCGFGGSETGTEGCFSSFSFGEFDFGPYFIDLSFDSVHGPFDVSMTNTLTSQGALTTAQRLNKFPGFQCVKLDGTNCVDFEIGAPPPGPNTWTGFYDISVFWFTDTNGTFSNDPGNRIRILHNRGDVPGNGFDTDITVIGSYESGSGFESLDPGIGGRDDNFQSILVAQAPVPEPGTLVLIGSGAMWLLRRRR